MFALAEENAIALFIIVGGFVLLHTVLLIEELYKVRKYKTRMRHPSTRTKQLLEKRK